MFRLILLLVAVGGLTSTSARTVQGQTRIMASGFSDAEVDVRLGDAEVIAARSRTRANLRLDLGRVRAYLSTRLSQSFVDPESQGDATPPEIRLREAFVDIFGASVDFRLGYQLIVWGDADGAFITDILSPLDLTEFLAQDFTEIRLAIPALQATWYRGSLSFTGVVAAGPNPSLLPSSDSPWNVLPETFGGATVSLEQPGRPFPGIHDAEAAGRVLYSGSFLRLSVLHAYARSRVPGFQGTLTLSSAPELRFHSVFPYRHVVGGTLSSTVFDRWILRGEVAYESGRPIPLSQPLATRAVLQTLSLPVDLYRMRPMFRFMAGLERSISRHLLRLQILGDVITGDLAGLGPDRLETAASALLIARFLRDNLLVQCLVLVNEEGDVWLNPSATYRVSDRLSMLAGSHIFEGESSSGIPSTASFGLFDPMDIIFVTARIGF